MKMAEMGAGLDPGVTQVDDPSIADNYVLVKVHAAPLCTEYKHSDRAGRGGFGHEAAGEVVALGPKARTVTVGDRVAVMPQDACGVCSLCQAGEHIFCQSPRNALQICNSTTGRQTIAQYVIQQDWLLMPFPQDMPYDHGAMACCGFGPGFNAMQAMSVSAGDTVLISGLGPVGLGTAAIALFRNARVFGIDINPFRIELAKELGVEKVFDPRDEDIKVQILTATCGRGVDKSVQVNRVESSAPLLAAVTRPRGHIAFIGQGGSVNVAQTVGKGHRLYGCWHWNHQRHAQQMITTLRGSASRIDMVVTHTFPIGRIHDALDLQTSGNCGKVIIHPWE